MTPSTQRPGLTAARYVKSYVVARNDLLAAAGYASGQGWSDEPKIVTAIRAPVDALDSTHAAALVQPIGSDFSAATRPLSVIGRLVGVRRAPFKVRLVGQSAGAVASWIGESQAKPLTTSAFIEGATLTPKKVVAMSVVSTELARYSSIDAEQFLLADLAKATGEALDIALLDPSNTGSDDKPQAVTNGSPTFTSSGSSLSAIDDDLQLLVNSLTANGSTLESAYWILRPSTATHLASLRGTGGALAYPSITAKGGTLLGLPVLTSPAVTAPGSPTESYIALVDASGILVADDDEARLDVGRHTSLQMSDDPEDPDTPTQLVSLWASNLACLRAERTVNWAVRRAGAAASLVGVQF